MRFLCEELMLCGVPPHRATASVAANPHRCALHQLHQLCSVLFDEPQRSNFLHQRWAKAATVHRTKQKPALGTDAVLLGQKCLGPVES
jgi:hypothetical protein